MLINVIVFLLFSGPAVGSASKEENQEPAAGGIQSRAPHLQLSTRYARKKTEGIRKFFLRKYKGENCVINTNSVKCLQKAYYGLKLSKVYHQFLR